MEYEQKLIEEYLKNNPRVKKEKENPSVFKGLITEIKHHEVVQIL